jgi:hypothetical protein
MRMSVRTIVLFGALAWVSGSLLVVMHRGVLAEGRVAGVTDSTTTVVTKAPKIPVGNAIVSLTSDRTMYLRRDTRVWRILDVATLRLLATLVPDREGRQNLDGLTLAGVVNVNNARDILSERIPDPVVLPGPLTVRVDASNPTSATLADGTLFNSVLAIQLRSLSDLPMSVTGITLTQQFAQLVSTSTSTLPSSTVFSGATVWEGTTRHGSRGVFGSNLRATVNMAADPIVLPARGIKVVMVKVDLPADTLARMGDYGARLAVTGAGDITQTGAMSVSGVFPLRGNLFSWVDGANTVGAPSVMGLEVNGYGSSTSTPSIFVNDATRAPLFQYNLSDLNSLEPFVVRQIRLRVEGTVADGDLANFELTPGQTSFPYATADAAVNGYVNFTLSQPFINLPGTNVDFKVTAIPTAAGIGHWFRLQLESAYDLTIDGGVTGVTLETQSPSGWPLTSSNGYWQIGNTQFAPELAVFPDNSIGQNLSLTQGQSSATLAQFYVYNAGQATSSPYAMAMSFTPPSGDSANATAIPLVAVERNDGTAWVAASNAIAPVNENGLQTIFDLTNVVLPPGQSANLRLVGTVSPTAATGTWATIGIPIAAIHARVDGGWEYYGPTSTAALQTVSISTPQLEVVRSTWLGDEVVVNPGEAHAPLAAYIITNPTDLPLSFNTSRFNLGYVTTTAPGILTNLALYRVNRASGTAEIITNTVPQVYGQTLPLYSSGSTAWLEPRESMDLEVRADISSTVLPGPLLTSSIPANGISMLTAGGQVYTGPNSTVIGQPVVVQIPTFSVSSVNSSPDTLSSIILAGTQNRLIQTLRLNAYTEDGHLDLYKITLQFDGSIGGIGNVTGTFNLGTVRLYHNGTLLGTSVPSSYGATTADVVFYFATPIEVPAWAPYDIDVKADMHNGSGADATQLMARIKSNSNADLEVRSESGGLLPSSYVNIGPLNTPSSWFLVHDAAPTIVALPLTGYHILGWNDEIARFEVRNYGQVPLRLDELKIDAFSSGLTMSTSSTSTYDRVRAFQLYDNNGTAIAYSNPSNAGLSATRTSSTLRFSSSTQYYAGWTSNSIIPASSSSTAGSRIFSLRADTSDIRAAGGFGVRTLQAKILGQTGYAAGNATYEPNWADGGTLYSYRPLGYTVWRGSFSASDSYPVLGMVASYN